MISSIAFHVVFYSKYKDIRSLWLQRYGGSFIQRHLYWMGYGCRAGVSFSFLSFAFVVGFKLLVSTVFVIPWLNMASESNQSPEPTPPDNASSTTTRSPSMVLSIKTLEQQTKPVTISRDASVLDLKHAVQGVFQIESNRQRLIFQGKMMKDGQNLTEYGTFLLIYLLVKGVG